MTTETNKALFRRVIEEIWNQGHTELFNEFFAADFVNHTPIEGVTTNLDGLKNSAVILRTAFPDLRASIEHIIAEGNLVGGYMIMYGTHKGEFMGVAGTGREVSAAMYSTLRIVDGRVVERWGVSDGVGMFQQLGGKLVVPAAD